DGAAMGEVPIGRVDDGLHRLGEKVSADDHEPAARGGFFLREDLVFRGYSTFAFALRLRTISFTLF
ncbi:MAG TPA: hypothetical protein VK043_13275, partial [Burkholderiales bacterium]|nr:hypothetical protein [Burkholderiales bacterium]